MIQVWLSGLLAKIGMTLLGVGIALGVTLLGTTAGYIKGRMDANAMCQVGALKESVKALKKELATREKIAAADQVSSDAARHALDEFDRQLEETRNALEDRNRQCLSDSDVERLRQLFGRP